MEYTFTRNGNGEVTGGGTARGRDSSGKIRTERFKFSGGRNGSDVIATNERGQRTRVEIDANGGLRARSPRSFEMGSIEFNHLPISPDQPHKSPKPDDHKIPRQSTPETSPTRPIRPEAPRPGNAAPQPAERPPVARPENFPRGIDRPDRIDRPEKPRPADRPERPAPAPAPAPAQSAPALPQSLGQSQPSANWSLFYFRTQGIHFGPLAGEGIAFGGLNYKDHQLSAYGGGILAGGISLNAGRAGFAHYFGGEAEGEVGTAGASGHITGISLTEYFVSYGSKEIKVGFGGGVWEQHTDTGQSMGPFGFISLEIGGRDYSYGLGGSSNLTTRWYNFIGDKQYDLAAKVVGEERLSRWILGIADKYNEVLQKGADLAQPKRRK